MKCIEKEYREFHLSPSGLLRSDGRKFIDMISNENPKMKIVVSKLASCKISKQISFGNHLRTRRSVADSINILDYTSK
jgi:hypothetical protein